MDTPRFYFTDTFREFRPLLAEEQHKEKTFRKGSMIFSSAKPLDFRLYIDSGLISYSVLHESGAEKALFYHGVGNTFPNLSITATIQNLRTRGDVLPVWKQWSSRRQI